MSDPMLGIRSAAGDILQSLAEMLGSALGGTSTAPLEADAFFALASEARKAIVGQGGGKAGDLGIPAAGDELGDALQAARHTTAVPPLGDFGHATRQRLPLAFTSALLPIDLPSAALARSVSTPDMSGQAAPAVGGEPRAAAPGLAAWFTNGLTLTPLMRLAAAPSWPAEAAAPSRTLLSATAPPSVATASSGRDAMNGLGVGKTVVPTFGIAPPSLLVPRLATTASAWSGARTDTPFALTLRAQAEPGGTHFPVPAPNGNLGAASPALASTRAGDRVRLPVRFPGVPASPTMPARSDPAPRPTTPSEMRPPAQDHPAPGHEAGVERDPIRHYRAGTTGRPDAARVIPSGSTASADTCQPEPAQFRAGTSDVAPAADARDGFVAERPGAADTARPAAFPGSRLDMQAVRTPVASLPSPGSPAMDAAERNTALALSALPRTKPRPGGARDMSGGGSHEYKEGATREARPRHAARPGQVVGYDNAAASPGSDAIAGSPSLERPVPLVPVNHAPLLVVLEQIECLVENGTGLLQVGLRRDRANLVSSGDVASTITDRADGSWTGCAVVDRLLRKAITRAGIVVDPGMELSGYDAAEAVPETARSEPDAGATWFWPAISDREVTPLFRQEEVLEGRSPSPYEARGPPCSARSGREARRTDEAGSAGGLCGRRCVI